MLLSAPQTQAVPGGARLTAARTPLAGQGEKRRKPQPTGVAAGLRHAECLSGDVLLLIFFLPFWDRCLGERAKFAPDHLFLKTLRLLHFSAFVFVGTFNMWKHSVMDILF